MLTHLWLGVLLFLLPSVLAAQPVARQGQTNALFFWEYDVSWQDQVAFEATITCEIDGQAQRRTQGIRPLSSADCQVLAAVRGQAWSSDTMCAETCMPVGDTTTTLVATLPNERSKPSNEAYALIPQACLPPVPVRPPAGGTSSKVASWAIGAGAVAVSGASKLGSSAPPLRELVNRDCVTWRITGPCLCNPTTPCVSVEYWEPTSLIEIVKQPGTSALPILGTLLKTGLSALGVSLFGGGGAGNAAGAGHTNMQYAEAHVWSFPQIFGGPCTACAPVNALPKLQYASEADAHAWRTTIAPLGIPGPALLPIGTWGNLFSRVGWVIHESAPIASGLQAFRALNIAFQPVTPLPAPEAHVALSPTLGLSGCMQLASPRQTPCFPAGTPGTVWDHGTVSADGTYLWIIWSKRTCCVSPPGTCGITVPGLGGHGANMCPL